MSNKVYKTIPSERDNASKFEEYSSAEVKYLLANRDRTLYISCPINNLYIPEFDKQVGEFQNVKKPNLTHNCGFSYESLRSENLFKGLST